jgi:hypothetical protein
MKHKLECLKRMPPFSWLLKLTGLGYSTCGVCGLPWNRCESHNIELKDRYNTFFPVCEHCWNHASKEKNREAVIKLYVEWKRMGFNGISGAEMLEAFEENWNETHQEHHE